MSRKLIAKKKFEIMLQLQLHYLLYNEFDSKQILIKMSIKEEYFSLSKGKN